MQSRTLGTALVVAMLAAGGAYAQDAKQPQDQMRAPGAGTNNPPGQKSMAPQNSTKAGPPTSSQSPVAADQQRAPGAGTSNPPGQKSMAPRNSTTAGPPTNSQPPVAADHQRAPGAGTATAPGQPDTTGVGPGSASKAPKR